MLHEVAKGVLVRQSAFCQCNAVVVTNSDRVVLVDPGVDGADLSELADDLDNLGRPVVAGLATHPHWDHVLWHERFGLDVPRYGSSACVAAVRARLASMREMTAQYAPGASMDLVGGIVPLPSHGLPRDGPVLRILEHQAHAPGHVAFVVEAAGVLVAGDMLSDVEVPLLDPRASDPYGDYVNGLDLLEAAVTNEVIALIPGHGSVAEGSAIRSRIDADRAYLEALRRGVDRTDPRLGPDATYGTDWLPEAHERNQELGRRSRA